MRLGKKCGTLCMNSYTKIYYTHDSCSFWFLIKNVCIKCSMLEILWEMYAMHIGVCMCVCVCVAIVNAMHIVVFFAVRRTLLSLFAKNNCVV